MKLTQISFLIKAKTKIKYIKDKLIKRIIKIAETVILITNLFKRRLIKAS